ncbi:MAG: FAD-dependent oxidoreductase [Anaerolineae bacterium]|nr:FAD-dependent oxidoreductase [Anaerolineae bacterium]
MSTTVPTDKRVSTLTLLHREHIAPYTMSFWFRDEPEIDFVPGQYIQVVLPHADPDERGIRRLFTISSSPTEEGIMITTKIPEPHSTFKRALTALEPGDRMAVTMVRGTLVLPDDPAVPCALLAAGIGITPYRSMVKYMVDTGLSRPTSLIYGEWAVEDFIFREVFAEGERGFGLKTVYTITGPHVPDGWLGRTGLIDQRMIREEIPDYDDRLFFVCGSPPSVIAIETVLLDLGLTRDRIKRDYFPGY